MTDPARPFILGIGGTPKPRSSSEKALEISLAAAAGEGAETLLIGGDDLIMPMYTAPVNSQTAEVARLLVAMRRADGIIISSPAYHGSISGLLKNALDYTEEMRTDERPYFDGKPVGLISCAAGWQGAGQTLQALRSIVHALRGWPTPLGAVINTSLPVFDSGGEVVDISAKFQLETVGRQVMQFCRWQQQSDFQPARAMAV
ncbi:NADPH-dependent FMN reductase [Sinorhizobium meliloti]|uniref:FMN reductase n=1 Tax=Rhizobium meliloti TaxID=382 RepID=A0A2J0YU74_RHIML|nr:NAD(P)H-dependent oxidoreductase [Sinorhizobium meliloti]PJR09921.1 FMN reductase [Sinorhizobium meliloti]